MASGERKIKILYHILPYMVGGAERSLLNLLKCLDKNKFDPIVASFSKSPLFPFLNSVGVRTIVVPSQNHQGHMRLVDLIKKCRIHIVQTSHYYPKAAMAASIEKVPHIWLVGSNIHRTCSNIDPLQRQDFLDAMAYLSVRIICKSKFIGRQFLNINPSKVNLIYPGIDLNQVDNVWKADKSRAKMSDENGFRIGMIAHLSPQKRHLDFIHAAKKVLRQFPQTKFFIFGRPYPNKECRLYERFLHKTVKKIGAERAIIFTEAYRNILESINHMNLVILPSVEEGSGNAILEAMALRKPVIACCSGGIKELVPDKVAGFLVPPKDPQKLYEKMITVLKNPEQAKTMGEAGRKRVEQLFNIKRIVRQFETIYQEVTSGGQPLTPCMTN